VLSFLVTLFFTRVKKRVTRSSAGGVEALALSTTGEKRSQIKMDSGFRRNDEQRMTSRELPAPPTEKGRIPGPAGSKALRRRNERMSSRPTKLRLDG
jgi:hypothetical protein